MKSIMAKVDPSYIVELRQGLSRVLAESETLVNDAGHEPSAGSIAELELQSFVRPQSIVTAFSISALLLQYSAEHLSLLAKALVEPIEPLASLTCVRSMLQAASAIVWIADPAINAEERVRRVFAHRYAGLVQQLKCAQSFGATAAEINTVKQRMVAVQNDALATGYQLLRDNRGNVNGIGTRMPSATDLIEESLAEGRMYRALSAVAHGHAWALIQLGFSGVGSPNHAIGSTSVHSVEPALNVDAIAAAGVCGVRAFAEALWVLAQYMGWNRDSVIGALERMFDSLHISDSQRFWREG